ncbi:transposase is4 [Holotrichia oblita]|uniref:Transposase is4 n=1 Tax=Holotrichia oblita TaxID=644536 RepID=A0ACB9TM50_HOLOL|nr:transposase is4 [Holotrichia oblita]
MTARRGLTETELLDIDNLSDIVALSESDVFEKSTRQGRVTTLLDNGEEEPDEFTEQNEIHSENTETAIKGPTQAQRLQNFCDAHNLTYKQDICWKPNVEYQTPPINWCQMKYSTDPEVLSPAKYFLQYFPDTLINKMVDMTNLFAVQNNIHNFPATNNNEIKKLIGIHITMGNLHFPRVKLYWDAKLGISIISENMTGNRFFKLRQCLCFVDNTQKADDNTDRFWKVRPLYNAIRSRCQELPHEPYLSIDEQMIPFKGQLNVKQYVKGKPCPWGVKLLALCGTSGILYDFVLYQGSTTEGTYRVFGTRCCHSIEIVRTHNRTACSTVL